MKKKIKKATKTKLSLKKTSLTKSLGELMKDEDGFVSKETILKVGLSTVAALGVTGALTDVGSGNQLNQTTHTNMIQTHNQNIKVPVNCAQHTNVTTHTSY